LEHFDEEKVFDQFERLMCAAVSAQTGG
jgi:hypothetical protein